METNNKTNYTEEEIYRVCEEKAFTLVDPALEHTYVFIYVLVWYCYLAGVSGHIAYDNIQEQYLPDKRKTAGLSRLIEYCYQDLSKHGTVLIKDNKNWVIPPHIKQLERIYRYAVRLKRRKQKWDDTNLIKGSQSQGLKKELVLSAYVFCDEQSSYEAWCEDNINGFENLIENKMEMYRNALNDTLSYRLINSGHKLQPMDCNVLWVFAQKNNFFFRVNEIDAFLKSNSVLQFDPILDYFKNLPAWGGEDYISILADHIKVSDEVRVNFNEMFRKALIRCVGCGLGEMVNRYVMVFSSVEQNTGKSTFIRNLCPEILKNYYTEAPLNGNKDDAFRLSETFVYNLEELSSLSARDVNELKAYISADSSNERKPYDRDAKFRVRRTNFWASTNKAYFLVDDTGNSRWLIYKVDGIDWNYSKVIDLHKVWAQAYQYYLNGERGVLTKEEVEFQTRNNRQFEVQTPEHEFIMEYFRPTLEGEGEYLNNYQLLEFFETFTCKPFKLNNAIFGKAMTQLGFVSGRKSIRGQSYRGYWVNRVERPDFTGKPLNHPFVQSDRLIDGMTEEEVEEYPYFVKFIHQDQLYRLKLVKGEDVFFHIGIFGIGEEDEFWDQFLKKNDPTYLDFDLDCDRTNKKKRKVKQKNAGRK